MKAIVFTRQFVDAEKLYPFSLTRRVQDFRVGILTIREKWERCLLAKSYDIDGEDELPFKTISPSELNKDYFLIKANLLPCNILLQLIRKLKPGDAIVDEAGTPVVSYVKFNTNENRPTQYFVIADLPSIEFGWDIFKQNANAIFFDYRLLTKGKKTARLNSTNKTSNPKNIFIEAGAIVNHAVINAADGPVYISKNALVMEGALLRGPLFIGAGAVVKMGAKIYGATTIGPGCTVGGEIKNVVWFANSNKAHDGYLGDSVIGEWCNMGAGTSNSNLKNTASNITVNLPLGKFDAGLKCGVLMGDFSRTAINTAINTGTVTGVSSNIFGNGLTPKFIPSFAWGFTKKVKYKLEKALADAANWKNLKSQTLTDVEKEILKKIYNNKKQNV